MTAAGIIVIVVVAGGGAGFRGFVVVGQQDWRGRRCRFQHWG